MSGFPWGGSEELWYRTAIAAHNSGHNVEIAVFKKEVINSIIIKENRFGADAELVLKSAKLSARIKEVGITYHERSYKEGKKIGLKDAFREIFVLFKYGLSRTKKNNFNKAA